MSYCKYCLDEKANPLHVSYHNERYGFPIHEDDELFGRLLMEINQAGLSWETILKKEQGFRKAYSAFSIEKIAAYGDNDRERLLSDASIIRNKLKVNAAIHNAQQILQIKSEYGTFKRWLDENAHLNREEWTKLFKKTFKFVGGEIVNEFLMSSGYLPGAHEVDCPTYKKIELLKPKWMVI